MDINTEEIPITLVTIDDYYFRIIMGRYSESTDELETFAHVIRKGVESQLDWDSINDGAKQYIEENE